MKCFPNSQEENGSLPKHYKLKCINAITLNIWSTRVVLVPTSPLPLCNCLQYFRILKSNNGPVFPPDTIIKGVSLVLLFIAPAKICNHAIHVVVHASVLCDTLSIITDS